jgi:hypothetical protein
MPQKTKNILVDSRILSIFAANFKTVLYGIFKENCRCFIGGTA